MRTGIVAGTVAAVFGSLLLAPVRDLLVGAWRLLVAIAGAIWAALAAPVPVWVLLVVVGIVALLVWRAGQRAAPFASAPKSIERPSPPRVAERHAIPRELD